MTAFMIAFLMINDYNLIINCKLFFASMQANHSKYDKADFCEFIGGYLIY